MKRPLIKTKAGQYSWLQFLALAISGIAYWLGSMTVAIAMLVVATLLGVAAMVYRLREARQINQQTARGRRLR